MIRTSHGPIAIAGTLSWTISIPSTFTGTLTIASAFSRTLAVTFTRAVSLAGTFSGFTFAFTGTFGVLSFAVARTSAFVIGLGRGEQGGGDGHGESGGGELQEQTARVGFGNHGETVFEFSFSGHKGNERGAGLRRATELERLDQGGAVVATLLGTQSAKCGPVTEHFAIGQKTSAREPDQRVEPMQALDRENDPIDQQISTADVGEFMEKNAANLRFGIALFEIGRNDEVRDSKKSEDRHSGARRRRHHSEPTLNSRPALASGQQRVERFAFHPRQANDLSVSDSLANDRKQENPEANEAPAQRQSMLPREGR